LCEFANPSVSLLILPGKMADDVPNPPKRIQIDDLLNDAIQRDNVPKVYANGFGLGLSNADVFIVFQRFGNNPAAVVNLSYTLAKTLAQRMGALVSELEAAIGQQNILTTDRIDAAFTKAAAEAKEAKEKSEGASGKDENIH
jgi:hypothetical protein